MVTQNIFIGLPKFLPLNGVYRGNVLGKHHQVPFNSGKACHAHKPLKLVHNDLCYNSKHSLTDVKYILTFIYDLYRFTWVYFLKNKSYVIENFKEFRALAKKQCGQHIKCFRFDNGGEYVSQQFEEYLLQSGISWKRYVPHTPQQNGMVERKNKTLVEMACCILRAKGISTKF